MLLTSPHWEEIPATKKEFCLTLCKCTYDLQSIEYGDKDS